MIIPDVNLLVYAYDSNSQWNARASEWWIRCLSGVEPVGLSWMVALGFIRLWTNPRVFENPMPINLAVSHVESWAARRVVRWIHPGQKHAEILFSFLRSEGRGGNLTTDAYLAALAMEFRAVIHTADTDFVRFAEVKWVNPLI